jgi:hypothetical protein
VTGIVGEDAHEAGADGVRRAKRWLEASMRVSTVWTNAGNEAVKKRLSYTWPGAPKRRFSFDLGGIMRGGDLDGHQFSAEVKRYVRELNQPQKYRKFLAQCYVAVQEREHLCDHLMWITWAPFNASVWDEHCTASRVRQAVLEHHDPVFGTSSATEAAALVNDEHTKAVANRLWLIVISDKQEQLLPLREWQSVIEAEIRRLSA